MTIKKLFMILFLGMFLINLASASVSYDNQTYEIDTWIPTWLGGDGYSNVTLIDNTDYCLIDCEATIQFNNEEPVNLLEDISFIDKKGLDVQDSIKNLTFLIGKYEDVKKTNPIYEEVCETIPGNETNSSYDYCYQNQTGEDVYYENELIWKEYNGTPESGESLLKIQAKKDPKKTMDWIVTFRGEDLVEWAWWNNDWDYKRPINLTADPGEFSYLETITYDADMNSDFSDLRFLNNAEDTEFNYTIESKTDGVSAIVRIYSQGETSFYMYYGNPLATTTSSASDTHFNPISMWYMDGNANDAVGTNDGTVNGATLTTGKIGQGYDFDGSNDYISLGDIENFVSSNSLSISGWFMVSSITDVDLRTIIAQEDTSTDRSFFLDLNTDGTLRFLIWNSVGSAYITQQSSPTISTDTWYYVNGIYNGSSLKLYLNGVQVGTTTSTTGTIRNSNDDIRIGLRTNGNNAMLGKIDEVGIWDRALTPTQIQALYNYTAPTFTVGAEESQSGIITIDYVTPPTYENYINTTNDYLPIQVNVTYDAVDFTNITYILTSTDGFSSNVTFTNETYFYNYTGLGTAHYHYYVEVCGEDQNTLENICFYSVTQHVNYDIDPPVINITSPTGTYNYLYENYSLDLNWTVTDIGEGVDSCWYIYNNVTTPLNCSLNTTSFNYATDINNLTFYANDTFGNTNSNFTSWNYKVLETAKEYNNETLEGTFETFKLYLTKGAGVNVQSVVLHYDGQTDTSSLFSSGSETRAESELFINEVLADTNNTLYFTVTLSDSTVFNTTNATQLVRNIELDDCSSQPDLFLTLNLLDEANQSAINGDIELYLSIINPDNFEEVLSFNDTYNGVSTKTFCSNIFLNESSFLLGAKIRYDSDNHSAEFYNIQRSNLSSYPKEYNLYDLKDEDTTKFKLIYRGENLIGVVDAIIQLQREYISEGVYKIVEAPLTSSDSTAVVHIDTNTNSYKATVVKDGVVLNTFDNLVFICQSELTGECTLDLQDYIVPPNSVSIENIQDFSYSISSDIDNKTITFDYSVPTGTTSSITVVASQKDIVGENTICNTTVSSAGGSIECAYNDSIQDSYIYYNIYKDGVQLVQKSYIVKDDLRDDFGGDNYFILIIFTISLVFMAILSPEWIVLNSIIAVIIGGATWLIRGMDFVLGLGAIAWLLLGAIIIIIKMAQKEDQ